MDTHTLQAFVTVAESKSFSVAAEKLFLTQSAVSKRIAQLESQLDARLFDRIGRSVKLTEAGQTLLPKAHTILLQLDDAKRSIRNLPGTVSGTLSLAASHHISLHRLPPILQSYSKEFPDVDLNLRFDESEKAYDGILRGELELALITLAPQPDENIRSTKIWQDKLRYVVASDHPLAQKDKISLAELQLYSAILPDSNTFTHQIVARQFAIEGLDLTVEMSTNYLDTIRMMVSIGLGWSLLPETMIDPSLTVLNTDSEVISRDLGYIYHRNRTLSNAAQKLVEILKDVADGSS